MTRVYSTLKLFLLSTSLLAGTILAFGQQPKKKNVKKRANIGINITNKHKQPETTYANFGLLSNYANMEGVGLNLISSVVHHNSYGVQVAGVINMTGENAAGLQLSSVSNVFGKKASGVIITGLLNVSGTSTNGFTAAGLGNISGTNTNGLAVGGLINICGRNASGMQISGLANITQYQRGMAISGLSNVTAQNMQGMQLSALLNIAGRSNKGVQIAGVGNVTVTNRGLQLGLLNFEDRGNGVQAGAVNVALKGEGVQLGIVNFCDSIHHPLQIGIVNLNPETRIQMVLSGGNLNKANAGIRFKNQRTYTEIGAGGCFSGLDKFSVSGYYRAGVFIPLSSRWEISGDAAFYHIETLKNKDYGCEKRMYAVQPRLNLSYQISDKVGIYAAGGYSWTKYYNHSGVQNHKPTFEIGLTLF